MRTITFEVGDDEPFFILRAQDVLAPQVVELWALSATMIHANTPKISNARTIAASMRDWQLRHGSKVPD